MAVFQRISAEEIKENFTHYGWIYGICPIYVGGPDENPKLATRNWFPEWPLDLMETLYAFACQTRMMFDPTFEPSYGILITRKI